MPLKALMRNQLEELDLGALHSMSNQWEVATKAQV